MKMKIIHTVSSSRKTLASVFALATVLLYTGCGNPAGAGEAEAGSSDHHGDDAAFVSTAHTHENPDETCFICDPEKREEGRLWCKEHGRYEDRCWLCHPELEDPDRLYCKEHALYEDECFLCHPELESSNDSASEETGTEASDEEHAEASSGLYCYEHDVPEIECAICQPDLAASLQPGGDLKIRFPSALAADKAGVRTDHPGASQATPHIEALCEVQYNLNTMAKVTPLARGIVREVRYDAGDQIAAGEVLVELHSAEVASAKSAFLSAIVEQDIRRQSFEREKRLKEQSIAAEKDFLEADAAYRTAQLAAGNLRQQLVNLGFSSEEIDEIEKTRDTSARLLVRAPFDVTLVERDAVPGEAVAVGDALFTIADLSTRWLTLSIPSSHSGQVHRGQEVEARFADLPGVILNGQITWVESSLDPRSRMLRARALVTDGAEHITTGLFGEARIKTGNIHSAAMVPRDAVQRHEGGDFVFVRNQPDLFALRRVALGASNGESVEVVDGLDPTDAVVTHGSFIVKSEFLKSRLGAGCTDH